MLPGLLAYFARRTFDAQVAADLTAETLADAYAARGGSATVVRARPPPGPTRSRRKLGRYLRRLRVDHAARRRLGMERVELAPDDVERIEAVIDFEHIGREVRQAFDRTAPRTSVRLCACA